MRIAVDFPAPFGPRNPKMVPGGTASESPASAVVLPYSFQTFFRRIGSAASGIIHQTPGRWGKFRTTSVAVAVFQGALAALGRFAACAVGRISNTRVPTQDHTLGSL